MATSCLPREGSCIVCCLFVGRWYVRQRPRHREKPGANGDRSECDGARREAGQQLSGLLGDAAAPAPAARRLSHSRSVSEIAEKLVDTRVVHGHLAQHPTRARSGREILGLIASTGKLEAGRHEESSRAAVLGLFTESMPKDHVKILNVEYVVRPELLMRFFGRLAGERSSVESTFHGTRADKVDAILRQGLLPSVCSTGAYGKGSYVGTHAGVAHQYADPSPEGLRFMCLVLAVVGSRARKGVQGMRTQATSLDCMVNPTQYCFVEEDRLLVTHLITYRIAQTGARRKGGGFEDPFQGALQRAVIRAGAEARKAKVAAPRPAAE